MLLLKSYKFQCFFEINAIVFAFLGIVIPINVTGAILASTCFGTCTDMMLNEKNREGDLPEYPLKETLSRQPSNIVKAHEILCDGLQQYLNFIETDLGSYLSHLIESDHTFVDEYGQEIRHYYKIISWIWLQHNETVCKNYAITKYENDKLDLCSIARFLSHQPKVKDRQNIMKRMGVALGYKCHPCTPYKRKEYAENIAPDTDHISGDGVSPEESLILCKDCDHQGNCIGSTSAIPLTTISDDVALIPASVRPESSVTLSTEGTLDMDSVKPAFDYTPCSYWLGRVTCKEISIEEIHRVFRRTAFPTFVSVDLTLYTSYKLHETFIPENFLENKRVYDIKIGYSEDSKVGLSLSLQVHPEAFQSTKAYTRSFDFSFFDCSLLDFTFLSGFDKLNKLKFSNVCQINRCLSTLPLLHSLEHLDFENCNGWREAYYDLKPWRFPTLANGLKSITIDGEKYKYYFDAMTDKVFNQILDWLLLFSSANTLKFMQISNFQNITQVPVQITSFKALTSLWLHGNKISTIKTGALAFPGTLNYLILLNNNIQEIEQGAIQGNYTHFELRIDGNQLTQFDQNVFEPILQQMSTMSESGSINALRNPIDCSEDKICQLNWIRRMKVKPRLQCSDRTSFNDLEPAGFNHCSVISN